MGSWGPIRGAFCFDDGEVMALCLCTVMRCSRSASGVLAAVQKALSATGTKHVSIVGHSLGTWYSILSLISTTNEHV